MKRVLLAGATGYLGGHIARELQGRSYPVRVIVRSPDKLLNSDIEISDVFKAEITQPKTIEGCCRGIDTVISTVGITRQKDGLTYMDVDYQANMNLLREAKASGVRKFIYVSVLNGETLRHLKICDAKEKFVEQLKQSGMEYCVIRPNGFFSDMTEFYSMAKKGRIYLFGNGEIKANPIHGEDLAAVCVEAIEGADSEVIAGGPETLTYNEIAKIAFEAAGTTVKIAHIPDWIRSTLLRLVRTIFSGKVYGPIEFFLTVSSIDMIAPEYGTHKLRDHFRKVSQENTE